ncbi:endonuclease-8 [Quadrisphaera granulorum]|uniref:DNA-(apurinic or apyrimidinic site) lyase n=1 Tax=Quadrisphaera granulorum TaxID=317664 RepID=A0A315ZNZ2_9ACTN|nr:DNA-formamidopyrimidine glycosylase family protein [Quadrisphaera granulorum]PWJ47355.1 endonuclease-8 [Quadrisphaera granulorum]SZE98802.1 endonuclease-8 [Quadrisphaera granulorum]
MPEGHTLHRLARSVRDAFGGRVVEATSPQGRFADGAALLDGHRVIRADAVGKHLLVGFSRADVSGRREPQRWLHVHLGLYGKVFFGVSDASVGGSEESEDDDDGARGHVLSGPPAPVGQVRLRLVTLDAAEGAGPLRWADLRGPTACEVMVRPEVDELRARLGPDPLRPDDGPERFVERAGRSRVSIGALLMHQDVLAGAGNIYRAEALFRAGIDPFAAGRDVAPERLVGVWDDLRVLMRAGVRSGRIVTTRPVDRGKRDDEVDGTPVRRGQAGSHYVYRRTGLPCRICATPVATAVVEARNLFWCPSCQAPGTQLPPFKP